MYRKIYNSRAAKGENYLLKLITKLSSLNKEIVKLREFGNLDVN